MLLDVYDLDLHPYPELAHFVTAETPETLGEAQQLLATSYPFSQSGILEKLSPLDVCSILGKWIPFEYLLTHHSHSLSNLFHALNYATQGNQFKIVEHLLHQKNLLEHLNPNGYDALEIAAANGHLQIFEHLLSFPTLASMVANKNNRLLHWACLFGQKDVAIHLLNIELVKRTIFSDDNTALRFAVQSGNIELVQHLLAIESLKSHAHTYNNQALCLAVSHGHMAVVQELLQLDMILEKADVFDNLPFRLAIQQNYPNIAMQLLEIPCVFNQTNPQDETYTTILHSFIQTKLQTLEAAQHETKITSPDEPFDIAAKDTTFYFCLLKKIIQYHVPHFNPAIHLLISLPSLSHCLHQRFLGGPPNELLRLAIQYEHHEAMNALLALPRVSAIYTDEILARLATQDAQNTHTASVHQSISAAALSLKARYANRITTYRLNSVLDTLCRWVQTRPEENIKTSAAKRCIIRLTQTDDGFIDPTSQLKIRTLLALAWIALHDVTRQDAIKRQNALANFLEGLYEIQRGNNLSDTNEDNHLEADDMICPAGAFNKIIEKLAGIHPDVSLHFITKETISLKFRALTRNEARRYLNEHPQPKAILKRIANPENEGISIIWPSIKAAVYTAMMNEFRLTYQGTKGQAELAELMQTAAYIDVSDIAQTQLASSKRITTSRVAFFTIPTPTTTRATILPKIK